MKNTATAAAKKQDYTLRSLNVPKYIRRCFKQIGVTRASEVAANFETYSSLQSVWGVGKKSAREIAECLIPAGIIISDVPDSPIRGVCREDVENCDNY